MENCCKVGIKKKKNAEHNVSSGDYPNFSRKWKKGYLQILSDKQYFSD